MIVTVPQSRKNLKAASAQKKKKMGDFLVHKIVKEKFELRTPTSDSEKGAVPSMAPGPFTNVSAQGYRPVTNLSPLPFFFPYSEIVPAPPRGENSFPNIEALLTATKAPTPALSQVAPGAFHLKTS